MGSFAATCGVSHLPIGGSDPVVFMFLTKGLYEGPAWLLRTLPVHAQYSDYGSIEDIEDSELAERVNLIRFQHDLVERGVGDNSCHDHAVFKTMTYQELADVADRILVHTIPRDPAFAALDAELAAKAAAYPSPLTRFIARLGELAPDLVAAAGGLLLVDEVVRGHYRIRINKHGGGDTQLLPLKAVLEAEYACVITAGSGSYAGSHELHVFPLPAASAASGKSVSWGEYKRPDPQQPLGFCMVRKDVWDALAKRPLAYGFSFGKRGKRPLAVQAVEQLWGDMQDIASMSEWRQEVGLGKLPRTLPGFRNIYEGPTPFILGRRESGAPNGLAEHVFEAAKLAKADPTVTAEQVQRLLNDLVDLWIVTSVLSQTRLGFAPSSFWGPQIPEWKAENEVHSIFAKVIKNKIARQKRDY